MNRKLCLALLHVIFTLYTIQKKKKKERKKKEAKAGSEGGLNLLKSQLSCRQRFGQGPGFLKLDLF